MEDEQKRNLLAIMENDPDYGEYLKGKIEVARQDKKTLIEAAREIANQHKEEIDEGTRKRAKLISEGASRGLTEEASMAAYGKFMPTVQTPILNFLYFKLKEDSAPAFEELREEFFKKFGHDYDGLSPQQLEEKYGAEYHTEPVDENVKEHPAMDEYIYGNMTHKTFQTIKKLKALSKSENEKEAFLAYTACMKFCKKYSLEFDKVPCNIE